MPTKKLQERVTISLSAKTHEEVAGIAAVNDVSISWVVRHALELFLRQSRQNGGQLEFDFTVEKKSNGN